jgi:hypothetical protein
MKHARVSAVAAVLASTGCVAHTEPLEQHGVPLRLDGAPIGDVSGVLDVYVSRDGTYTRFTVQTEPHIWLQNHLFASRGDQRPRSPRVDICADNAVFAVELRDRVPDPSATVKVLGHTLAVDKIELCLRDSDLAKLYVLAVCHWDAPDGSRVFIESALDDDPSDPTPVRLRSEPPRPENELLGILMVPAP